MPFPVFKSVGASTRPIFFCSLTIYLSHLPAVLTCPHSPAPIDRDHQSQVVSGVDHELLAAFFNSGIPAPSYISLSAVTMCALELRTSHPLSLPLSSQHRPRPYGSTAQNHNILTPTNIYPRFDVYVDIDRSQGGKSIVLIISVLGDGGSVRQVLEGGFEKRLDLFVCCGW